MLPPPPPAHLPVAVVLHLAPSLMPPPWDVARWEALHAIGLNGHSGRRAPLETMTPFAFSAEELTQYADPAGLEPPSVAMLRFVVWLLVAPSDHLADLLTAGADVADASERGVIGRTLVALVDANLHHLDSVQTAALGAAPTPTAGLAARRASMLQWRSCFAMRFGVPPSDAATPRAAWAHINIWAQLQCKMPPVDGGSTDEEADVEEPQTAHIARQVRNALREVASSASLVTAHTEPGWLRGAILEQLHTACVSIAKESTPELLLSAAAAGGGGDDGGAVRARRQKVVNLLAPRCWPRLPPSVLHACRLFERLRIELAACTGRTLLDQVCLEIVTLPVASADNASACTHAADRNRRAHGRHGEHNARSFRPCFSLVLSLGEVVDASSGKVPDAGTLTVMGHSDLAAGLADKPQPI